jgi:hypothetical protein
MLLYNQFAPHYTWIVPHPAQQYRLSLLQVIQLIEPQFESPIALSIISAFIRCAPCKDLSEYDELIAGSIEKETSVHQLSRRGQQFNYSSIFQVGEHRTRVHPYDQFYSPTVSLDYCEWFYNWRDSIHHSIHYPQYSTKYLGRISDVNCRRIMDHYGLAHEKMRLSTYDLYNTYCKTGIKSYGPTEVQLAFKFNDVKPRVFYRIGATAYWSALYIHDVVNDIMQAFPHTSTRTRYSIQRLVMGYRDQVLIVYDYSTFTSSLEELYYFVMAIAEFLRGTEVFLWDHREGMIKYDAGELMEEYAKINCRDCEYDMGEILGSDEPLVMISNLAGLLGVYGNINLSLSLHGLSLCLICGRSDKCSCIGDDALGVIRRCKLPSGDYMRSADLVKRTHKAIGVIGSCAPEKTVTFDLTRKHVTDEDQDVVMASTTEGWHYVKRPIRAADNNIYQGELLDLPLPYIFLSEKDDVHTVQYPSQLWEKRQLFVTAYCNLLDQLKHKSLPEESSDKLEIYLSAAYKILGLDFRGYLPRSTNPEGLQYMVTPPIDRSMFGLDFREFCWDNRTDEYFILDLSEVVDEEMLYETLPREPEIGYSFKGTMHASWRYFCDSGILHRKRLTSSVLFGPSDKSNFVEHLLGRPPVYIFTVNDKLPDFWLDACTSVPLDRYVYTQDIDDY